MEGSRQLVGSREQTDFYKEQPAGRREYLAGNTGRKYLADKSEYLTESKNNCLWRRVKNQQKHITERQAVL